jgi:predicted HicB family RNase H-like nuclease
MNNILIIDDHRAVIVYDPEIDMFRGEFMNLSGGADFYAKDTDGLRREGSKSLEVYLAMCKENAIEPYKSFSGKFNIRISPELHAAAVTAATAKGQSLNKFVSEAIEEHIN